MFKSAVYLFFTSKNTDFHGFPGIIPFQGFPGVQGVGGYPVQEGSN